MSKEWPTDTATVTVPVAINECGSIYNNNITKDDEFNHFLLNLTKINNILIKYK